MRVPFLDLKAQYESIKDEIDDAIRQVIDSCAFAGGPFVEKFEREFAGFCGSEHAVGVGSGTEALWLALTVLGVGRGDEVITVPNTFIATAEAIWFCGAKPVFVDIDKQAYTMDANLLGKAINEKTKAIIPVHIFGQPCDMDAITDIARKNGLYVIEDACQAHGAEYKKRKAGTIGDMGCFSFYPGKNLGAYGEAGAVVCNKNEYAIKLRMLRDHGQDKKYDHQLIGWNARMDGIQAAILSVKLKYLPEWNALRRKCAGAYNHLLSDVTGIITPVTADYAKHVFHIYAIRVKNRNKMLKAFANRDVSAGIHYPIPLHLQDAFTKLSNGNGSQPIAEQCAKEFLSLPIYPELTEYQIDQVVRSIKEIS